MTEGNKICNKNHVLSWCFHWVQDYDTPHVMPNAYCSYSMIYFKYPKLISHHKREKHWVDNTNNQCHDPIALSVVWRIKWWPTRQFMLLLEMTELKAASSRAQSRKKAEHQASVKFPCAPVFYYTESYRFTIQVANRRKVGKAK